MVLNSHPINTSKNAIILKLRSKVYHNSLTNQKKKEYDNKLYNAFPSVNALKLFEKNVNKMFTNKGKNNAWDLVKNTLRNQEVKNIIENIGNQNKEYRIPAMNRSEVYIKYSNDNSFTRYINFINNKKFNKNEDIQVKYKNDIIGKISKNGNKFTPTKDYKKHTIPFFGWATGLGRAYYIDHKGQKKQTNGMV